MISIAIGCYFVFPISIVTLMAMQGNSIAVGGATMQEGANAYALCTTVGILPNFEMMCGDDIVGYFLKEEELKMGAKTLEERVTTIGEQIVALYLQAMFYPLVALIITFTFIRSTATIFGADLAELGRGLLKLI
jgi:hypothetical protein